MDIDEENMLQRIRNDCIWRYEDRKGKLPQKYQILLEQATKQRYLVVHERFTRSVVALINAYKPWCMGNGQPELIVIPAHRYKDVQAQIELQPIGDMYSGLSYISAPELDFTDNAIHHLMLLAHEYSYSAGHLHLRFVRWDHVDEVAQELLAFYDRMHQRMQEGQK